MCAVDVSIPRIPRTQPRVIVAAFDGSPKAEAALSWAADEAALRHDALEVVQVVAATELEAEAREQALTARVADLLRRAGKEGETPVRTEICRGSVVRALEREACVVDADLLVIGTTRSLVHDLANGMVAEALAHPGQRPVVAVPNDYDVQAGSGQAITVGLDGSIGGRAALRWAMAEAAIRRVPVRAVMAWTDSPFHPAYGAVPIFAQSDTMARAEAHAAIESEVEAVRASTAGADAVEVVTLTARGDAFDTLQQEARRGDMLVVGNRRHNALTALLLGSTARSCMRHCSCPVVIVPAGWRGRE